MRAISILLILIVISAVVAQAVQPAVTIDHSTNLGSNWGWIAGTTNTACDLSWTTSAGAYKHVGIVSGPYGEYIYPLAPGTNRVTVQCDNAEGSAYARASIDN